MVATGRSVWGLQWLTRTSVFISDDASEGKTKYLQNSDTSNELIFFTIKKNSGEQIQLD